MLGTKLVNVDTIAFRLDVGTEMGSLDGYFDGSNDVNLEILLFENSLEYTDGKVLVYDDGIKLGFTDGKVIRICFGNVDGIILGLDVGTELGYLDASFHSCNDSKLSGLLIGASLVSTDGKSLGSD